MSDGFCCADGLFAATPDDTPRTRLQSPDALIERIGFWNVAPDPVAGFSFGRAIAWYGTTGEERLDL